MQIFTLAIQETRVRQRRIAAPDALTAEKLARRSLRRGDQILGVSEQLAYGDERTAREALGFILGRPFLRLGGDDATVADWLRLCAADPAGDTRRARALSVAGLRVAADRLSIGSAACIPTLTHWCDGTPWAGSRLTAALRGLPGTTLTNMTYAGRRSRSVQLPLAEAVAMEGEG